MSCLPVPDSFRLDDRMFIVTGGLGYVGRAVADALHDVGASVVSLDLQAPFDTTEAPDHRSDTWNLYADVTSKASVEAALERVVASWGVPHGLVNALGIQPSNSRNAMLGSSFEVHRYATWEQAVGLALSAPMLSCQVVGASMAAEGRGAIVNLSSIFGLLAPDHELGVESTDAQRLYRPASVAAAQAGVLNLSKYLATYWARRNVRVNTVTLGCLDDEDQTEAARDAHQRRTALGRLARANDVKGAVVFLLSDASAYVTGANLVVDGGWSAS